MIAKDEGKTIQLDVLSKLRTHMCQQEVELWVLDILDSMVLEIECG